jgi:glutathione S-transferase
MRLYYSETSPYARKVRLVVREKHLEERVQELLSNPFDDAPELTAANPLGKVPTLVLENDESLFDSPLLCAYLDCLGPGPRLIPEAGPERWRVLWWEALSDGILDAAYNLVMERRRPEGENSLDWMQRWIKEIGRSLNHVETRIGGLPQRLSLAQLALASALGYLDFRLPDLSWRGGREGSAAWYQGFAERPSMQETWPKG